MWTSLFLTFWLSSLLKLFFVLQPSLLVTAIINTPPRPQEASLYYQAQMPQNTFALLRHSCSYNHNLKSLWSLGSICLWWVNLLLFSRAYFQILTFRFGSSQKKIMCHSSPKSPNVNSFSCSLYRFLEHGELCGTFSAGSTCGFNPVSHRALWRLAVAIKSSAMKHFGLHPLLLFRGQELIVSLHSALTCQFRKLYTTHFDLHFSFFMQNCPMVWRR